MVLPDCYNNCVIIYEWIVEKEYIANNHLTVELEMQN